MTDAASSDAQSYKNDRSFVSVNVGELVCHHRAVYRITQVLDFSSVLGIEVETGKPTILRIVELKPFLGNKIIGPYAHFDLEEIGAEDWAIAQQRFAIIQPLLTFEGQSKQVVEQVARQAKVDTVTVYRWLRLLDANKVSP